MQTKETVESQINQAASIAFENAKERWLSTLATGRKTECIIESTDVFEGLSRVSLPSTDEMESKVEDALMEQGYYAKATEAYQLYTTSTDVLIAEWKKWEDDSSEDMTGHLFHYEDIHGELNRRGEGVHCAV